MHYKNNILQVCKFLSVCLLITFAGGCEPEGQTNKDPQSDKIIKREIDLTFDLEAPQNALQKLCTDHPSLWMDLMDAGHNLGVRVLFGDPELPGKDATYKAIYGRLGDLTLSTRAMTEQTRCQLFSHELIHVLQHLKENLKGVEPLGWPVSKESVKKFGSIQEAEAYTYQNRGELILNLIERAKAKNPWIQ